MYSKIKAKENLKANFKETDLFKVFQSAELSLADITNNSTGMVNLIALRNAVYSSEFRRIVSKITGVHDLIERVDCSANAVRKYLNVNFIVNPLLQLFAVLVSSYSMQTVVIFSATMMLSVREECLT